MAAAQLARHAGLHVVGTASAAKKDFVASLGVAHVEPGPGVADRVAAAAPDGIDAIFDLVGGRLWKKWPTCSRIGAGWSALPTWRR
ncbi:zinc-binding dehydrogenase [Acrocarpospora sp. B8E8]|uniref:zinc-binding dehydrogenase n=1 Tax=Acrocarpospora sp. B8E8 TaxID=3153572 RepID=UPI00325CC622